MCKTTNPGTQQDPSQCFLRLGLRTPFSRHHALAASKAAIMLRRAGKIRARSIGTSIIQLFQKFGKYFDETARKAWRVLFEQTPKTDREFADLIASAPSDPESVFEIPDWAALMSALNVQPAAAIAEAGAGAGVGDGEQQEEEEEDEEEEEEEKEEEPTRIVTHAEYLEADVRQALKAAVAKSRDKQWRC